MPIPSLKTPTSADTPKRARGVPDGRIATFFAFRERHTNFVTESLGGATSFVTAAYLTIVIPSILATAGIDRAAATTATILMFVVGTVAMALYAKLPLVVGPGIGGAALLATTLAVTEHVPWPVGLGIAFWSGLSFLILTLVGLRSIVVRIVPAAVKMALSAAIGLFIAVLGFRNAGLVVADTNLNALRLGNIGSPGALVALFGLAVAVALHGRKVAGGILIAVLAASAVGIPLGVTSVPPSFLGLPHSVASVSWKLDIVGALRPTFFPYMFAFLASEFFSTMGTTLAVATEAGWLDEDGNMAGINGPFVVDSCSATLGPMLGVPALTALIESAAGVEAGARSGFASLVTAAMFLLSLLFAPIILMVPKEATAPALILVGLSMFMNLRKVEMRSFGDALPAVLVVVVTLVANNFGTGIAAGIVTYVFIQIVTGNGQKVSPGLYLLTLPLLYFFWIMGVRH